jgi:platelet-activating factor acetylhydrolase
MSFLSRLNPVPQFPPYSGPYAVGSFEIEIPVASLSHVAGPNDKIKTVQFRVFYPTDKENSDTSAGAHCRWFGKQAESKPVRWLPEPFQREYLSGYARFLGASSGFAEIISYACLIASD